MDSQDPTIGYLGHGVNRVLDRLQDEHAPGPNVAVEGQVIAGGLGGETRCSVCRTASALAQAMQQRHGGGLTGLGFLPLLGAKMAFFHALQTTIYSLSVVVHAWRVSAAARLSQARLRPGLSPPRTEAELLEFVTLYGDSYLSSVDLGGECIGVFTFRSETREQAERVEQALQLGGVIDGIQLGADVHSSLETAVRSSGISFEFRYGVWGCSAIPPLQPDTLVPFALGFSGRSIDRPILLDLETEGYETIPEIGTAFMPVAANRELFSRRDGLLRRRQRLVELINQMDDTRRTLDLYGVRLPDADRLAATRQTAQADLAGLDALVQSYQAAPTVPLALPELPSLAGGSPRIRATVEEEPATRIGRMESPQGQPFSFPFERATAVQNQVRLIGIGLEAGWRVDKLRLRYSSTVRGEALKAETHGGDRGVNLGDISLGPGEGLTGIYSEFGTNIDKLRLVTDQGVLENFGDRGDRQHPVDWKRPPGQVVLGFSGRSDDGPAGALYALQAVVARIEGIDWQPIDTLDLNDG
jgi:hypothetical protein